MNSKNKLVAAAQRAARKLARAEGIPYQTSLDRIAVNAGRSTWTSFLADPVAVDQAAATAANEPDFTKISPETHLHAAIEYGIKINAHAFLARPELENTGAKLVYSSNRSSDYDHPIDARGLNVPAMMNTIKTSPATATGLAVIQDAECAYKFDNVGEDIDSQLRISFDLNSPPVAPIVNEIPTTDDSSQKSGQKAIAKAIREAVPQQQDIAPHNLLDTLTGLPALRAGADIQVEAHGDTCEIMLKGEGVERIIRTDTLKAYKHLNAMIKDRGRMDQMETRVSQYGDWKQDIEGEIHQVHVATEPASERGLETLRIGFKPFIRRNFARPNWRETPKGGMIPLGSYGLIRKTMQYAEDNDLVVVSGSEESDPTMNFVIPSILASYGNDVIVTDMKGDLLSRLGATWQERGPILHLDPRATRGKRSPAFNPFHPDMMPTGHADAAAMIGSVLFPGHDIEAQEAKTLFAGIVDLLHAAPQLRPDGYDEEQAISIPMAIDWFDKNHNAIEGALDSVAGTAAIRAEASFDKFVAIDPNMQDAIKQRMSKAFLFAQSNEMRRLLDPEMEEQGSKIAASLKIGRDPVLIITGGDWEKGEGILPALIMETIAYLRSDFALRQTHFHINDAEKIGKMPWLSAALETRYGGLHSTSISVIIQNPAAINDLCDTDQLGRIPGIEHWLVEEIQDIDHRKQIANVMGIPVTKIPAHKPSKRRIHITGEGTRLLLK